MKMLTLIILSIYLSACASVERSTILGAVLGGTIGGLIGNSNGHDGRREQSTLVGAAIGTGLGSLIGYSSYKEEQKKQREQTLKQNPLESRTPFLTAPKVRRVWVPAKIEGDKYVDGHYMYVIEKTSTWSE